MAVRFVLGLYPCKLSEGTKAYEAYQDEVVYERHRHRYEFNNQYRQAMEEAGFVFSGTSPDGRLVEIIELQGSPMVCGFTIPPRIHLKTKSSTTIIP